MLHEHGTVRRLLQPPQILRPHGGVMLNSTLPCSQQSTAGFQSRGLQQHRGAAFTFSIPSLRPGGGTALTLSPPGLQQQGGARRASPQRRWTRSGKGQARRCAAAGGCTRQMRESAPTRSRWAPAAPPRSVRGSTEV
eukprot:360117-Chlamydomonas_euryale.AAC.5